MIKFTKDNTKVLIEYGYKPILNIIRINCLFTNGDWTSRIFNASMTIKILCFDKDKKEIASSQESLVFGAHVTPYHRQPVLEINRFFKFSNELFSIKYDASEQWSIEIELNNIVLNNDESINLDIMDSEHIRKRIYDWKDRINNLYNTIENWIADNNELKMQTVSDLTMYEEMMQNFEISREKINSANIFLKGKLIMSLKPYGLWIIGANGRIDIISKNGNFVLMDYSSQFQQPDWKIFLKNKKENFPFKMDVFLKLLTE